jgi:hypothetical protein
MIRRLLVLFLFSIVVIGNSVSVRLAQSASPQPCVQDHDAWLADLLRKMDAIKPGMTRAELLQVFRTEGGLSTGLRRTFVSRDCPQVKVDVEFKPVTGADSFYNRVVFSVEDNRDVIVKVSKPYLQFSVGD